ncbi:hypothetical protein R3P38DRAFT_3231124 [Favolaschia claudopus]|uniref:Uncharacterized protein n=1 Tax=Favolaschia claudopus TaxID=2862362 RepID=A0AAV9ZKP7_9AGAR
MRFEILLAFALAATTSAAPSPSLPAGIVSVAAMKDWIATTDAELTFAGAPIDELAIFPGNAGRHSVKRSLDLLEFTASLGSWEGIHGASMQQGVN